MLADRGHGIVQSYCFGWPAWRMLVSLNHGSSWVYINSTGQLS